jgi:hypothetical protein
VAAAAQHIVAGAPPFAICSIGKMADPCERMSRQSMNRCCEMVTNFDRRILENLLADASCPNAREVIDGKPSMEGSKRMKAFASFCAQKGGQGNQGNRT